MDNALTVYNGAPRGRVINPDMIAELLRGNPEIPDAMRDFARFVSPAMRHRLIGLAAVGDFILKMDIGEAEEIYQQQYSLNDMYGTMKKYIPLNRRQSIDSMMHMMENMQRKIRPKPAANGLEGIINTLTRINEINKLTSTVGTVRDIAGLLSSGLGDMFKSNQNNDGIGSINIDEMLDMVKNFIGK